MRLRGIRDTKGPNALAGFGSAKGANDEACLFQKLTRTGFGTNNVDHCTRLCHASSVAALLEEVGSGAVSNPLRVVLPASAFPEKTGTFTNTDRQVQLGRQAINPPGDARQDLWIIQQMANGMGLDWHYDGAKDVFNEMRKAMHSIAGITWERLEAEHSVTYPCENEGDPGDEVVFIERFPTQSGRAKLVPAKLISANEKPDADFPMVLITGRQLEHWH
ncbi:molybdopterin-dependent oxidoreductase, partial [Methyloversatilis sp. XJ19-13]|uniref:molybdopterin oxidoreductase family protein n=1 Tax=Methyloversatilis sp. XJ19-13 TaxID=2963430 RepID=UPI00211B80C5